MDRKSRQRNDVAVRCVLRWLPDRKVWTIVATWQTIVVCEEATSHVGIDRTDLVRIVGAIRNELESWIIFPEEHTAIEQGMNRARALAEQGEAEAVKATRRG